MVTITEYRKVEPKDGKPFNALVLQGELELVKSKSGNTYATAKKAQITSTFDEMTCKKLLGKTLPGKIVKIMTDQYDYTIPGTDEVIQLDYQYRYEENVHHEDAVFQQEIITA